MVTVRNSIPGSAPKTVGGAPSSVPGAPHFIPGGPPRNVGGLTTTVPHLSSAGEFRDVHTRQLRDFSGRYAGPNGIAWVGLDTVSENIFRYGQKIQKDTQDAMENLAKEMEAYAKQNAPWQDDSTDARSGLKAKAIHGPDNTTIFLGHTMPYGIWLEVRWGGKFAIIVPTLRQFAPRVLGRIVAGR